MDDLVSTAEMASVESSEGHCANPLGIATLHYGYNEGAILQAHALSELVALQIPEFDVRVIDHRYRGKQAIYDQRTSHRTEALARAINDWLPLSNTRTQMESFDDICSHLKSSYSGIIVGSDVVWSLRYQRRLRRFTRRGILPRQTDPFFPAFPNLYWPSQSVEIPRMAYAASVGMLEFDDVPSGHRRKMRDVLSEFTLISVRDERTRRFVERLSADLASRTEVMPDPTLAHNVVDTSVDGELRRRLEGLGVDFSRPRLGLICPDHPEVRKSIAELRNRGCQIIGITTQNTMSDVELFREAFHPLEWSRLFHFMDCCLIERMHAAIFCLLNHRPFVILDQYVTPGETETKVSSLMQDFQLSEFCHGKDSVTGSMLTSSLLEVLSGVWDWDAVDRTVAKGQERATQFVRNLRPSLIPSGGGS